MIKEICYRILKSLGLFQIALLITKSRLRILCYHGFALGDEASFRPRLFIRSETFRRRMEYLARNGFTVLPLDKALAQLDQGTLPAKAVVLTIDDGLAGVFERALPILKTFGYPAMTYVTSYHVTKGTPVFRLIVQYMFWKTQATRLNTEGLGLPLERDVEIGNEGEKEELVSAITDFGETQLDENERVALAKKLGERLGTDYEDIARSRILSLMAPQEIKEATTMNMDIQLHTHRHRFPVNRDIVLRELKDNREVLEPLVGKPLQHFCYPSGFWSAEQWPWLQEAGVRTATTCIAGLNDRDTPRHGLRRFLDGEYVRDIEFEAELCGVTELLRRGRSAVYRLLGRAQNS